MRRLRTASPVPALTAPVPSGPEKAIEAEGIPLLEEHDRHTSLRKYIVGDYQVITF
jgi:hypothetical protein